MESSKRPLTDPACPRRRSARRIAHRSSCVLLLLVCACDDTAAPEPIFLEIVSGDAQEGQAAVQLAEPLVARVTGADSIPREGVPVLWETLDGDGSVGPATFRSDADGLVEAWWTLAGEVGPQEVRATADGETVTFGAWATPPPPKDWADVLLVEATAYVAAGSIVAEYSVTNLWAGTVELKTSDSCFASPSLWTESGDLVAAEGFAQLCVYWVVRKRLAPGQSRSGGWKQATTNLAPGTYTVRITFKKSLEVNGRPTTLPAFEGTVIVGG